MDEICLNLVLDLEANQENLDFSEDTLSSYINQSLRLLFGDFGVAIPYKLECTDSKSRKLKISLEKSLEPKFRCALSLLSSYQKIPCCLRTLSIDQQ